MAWVTKADTITKDTSHRILKIGQTKQLKNTKKISRTIKYKCITKHYSINSDLSPIRKEKKYTKQAQLIKMQTGIKEKYSFTKN